MFVCFSHYPNVLRYAINGFSLSWVWISHGGDWWVMFLAFISTQKLFIVFSPLSYGGNERVAGWVFCPWPRLNHPRTGCSVGQIVILVFLSCPELQDICAEGWQGQYGIHGWPVPCGTVVWSQECLEAPQRILGTNLWPPDQVSWVSGWDQGLPQQIMFLVLFLRKRQWIQDLANGYK